MDPRGNQVRTSSASLASAADYDDTHQLLSLPLVSSVTEMPNVEFLESARFALTYSLLTPLTHPFSIDLFLLAPTKCKRCCSKEAGAVPRAVSLELSRR